MPRFHVYFRAFKILFGSRHGTVNAFKKIDHGTENKKLCGEVQLGTVLDGHGTKFGPPTVYYQIKINLIIFMNEKNYPKSSNFSPL